MYDILKDAPIDSRIKTGEITLPQVKYIISNQEMWPTLPSGVTYNTYREIRRDPTIALARALIIATIQSGSWSVEADEDVDDEIIEFISSTMMPLREDMMEAAACGTIDFGWQSFEKVFDVRGDRVVLSKLKPLLQDITLIMVDNKTGVFLGVKQVPLSGTEIYIAKSKVFYLAIGVEGTYWYGTPLLENCRIAYNDWVEANKSATSYDKKIAGAHFIVYYPPGTSKINDTNTDNSTIAYTLLTALESSGSITVPRTVIDFVDNLNETAQNGWKIEILEASGGQQTNFNERLRYFDALKVRGLLVPERTMLEGQFGTKAEAGEHGDMAIVNIQQMDEKFTAQANKQIVDQLLALNFGVDYVGKVRLVATPLVDEQTKYFKELYTAILANPEGFGQEFMTLDTDAIKDKLGLPKTAVVAQAGEQASPLEKLAASLGILKCNAPTNLYEGQWITTENGHKILIAPGEDKASAMKDFKRKTELLDISSECEDAGSFLRACEYFNRYDEAELTERVARKTYSENINSVSKKTGHSVADVEESFHLYTGSDYPSFQEAAKAIGRGGKVKFKEAAILADSIENFPVKAPNEIRVMRGVNGKIRIGSRVMPGKVVRLNRFTSATADAGVAGQFGTDNLIEIVIPKGKSGFACGVNREFVYEKEFIFSPRARFKVINKTKAGKKKGKFNLVQLKFLGN